VGRASFCLPRRTAGTLPALLFSSFQNHSAEIAPAHRRRRSILLRCDREDYEERKVMFVVQPSAPPPGFAPDFSSVRLQGGVIQKCLRSWFTNYCTASPQRLLYEVSNKALCGHGGDEYRERYSAFRLLWNILGQCLTHRFYCVSMSPKERFTDRRPSELVENGSICVKLLDYRTDFCPLYSRSGPIE
jgi:hypothetical protein